MNGYFMSAETLKYKSHGTTPGTRVYLASTCTGLALSESEYGCLGQPRKLKLAHSWSSDHPSVCILWILNDCSVQEDNGVSNWSRPANEQEYRRLTFHPVSILSWDWLKNYCHLWLNAQLSSASMTVASLQRLADQARRGSGTLFTPSSVKLPSPLRGPPSSTAMSPYQELTRALEALNKDSQAEEID